MTIQQKSVRRSPQATVVFAIACLACFVLLVSWILVQSYNDAAANAETRARAFAQVVVSHSSLLMESSYQALDRIDAAAGDRLDEVAPSDAAVGDLNKAVSNLPVNVRAWLIDSDGTPRLSNTSQSRAFNVADRDYFIGVKAGETFRISPLMISRSAGDPIFNVAKRIERNGAFKGAAVIVIPATFLDTLRGSLDLGPDSTLGLIRADGMMVTRSPVPAEASDLSKYVLFTDYLKQADQGTYFATSPTDGVERIVAYQRVPGYPLVAVASIARSEAMTVFWATAGVIFAFSVPGLIGLGTFAVWTIRSQRALISALDENETLFREIHHRVKNNLQQVAAVINMQPISPEIRDDIHRRIGAMVAVHEHIYGSDSYARIDLSSFLPRLAQSVTESAAIPATIETKAAPAILERDQALPFALILSEVISNALKHGYPRGGDAHIDVTVERVDDKRARLTIKDNGAGFDRLAVKSGTGSRLIRGLVGQLQGEMAYKNDSGTTFTLVFAVEGYGTTE